MAFYINAKPTQVSATPTKAQCVHNATNVSCKKCELLVKGPVFTYFTNYSAALIATATRADKVAVVWRPLAASTIEERADCFPGGRL